MHGEVDLHLHSDASDGLLPPGELARRAAKEGLRTIALSDHDTTAGLAEARAAAPAELELVPAIELTCRVRAGALGTVHVLGYGVDPASPELEAAGRRNRLAKRAQVRAIVDDLRARERIDLAWDEVAGGRPEDGYLGRHHVAGALVRRGLARSRGKAFRRYLKSERVPAVDVIPAAEAVAALRAAGGLVVLAHPTRIDLQHHLKPLLALGIDGLEAHRARQVAADRERILALAARHGLLVSGGSDWHGHHPEPPLGHWRPPPGALAPLLEAVRARG